MSSYNTVLFQYCLGLKKATFFLITMQMFDNLCQMISYLISEHPTTAGDKVRALRVFLSFKCNIIK